MLTAT